MAIINQLMHYAIDAETETRVYIDEADKDKKYICECCGKPVIPHRGNIRQHTYAHKNGHCTDNWKYEDCSWHTEMQKELCRRINEITEDSNAVPEKYLSADNAHRADIYIQSSHSVIELQHSKLTLSDFKDRNEHYLKLGCNVIWIFDKIDDYTCNRFVQDINAKSGTFEYDIYKDFGKNANLISAAGCSYYNPRIFIFAQTNPIEKNMVFCHIVDTHTVFKKISGYQYNYLVGNSITEVEELINFLVDKPVQSLIELNWKVKCSEAKSHKDGRFDLYVSSEYSDSDDKEEMTYLDDIKCCTDVNKLCEYFKSNDDSAKFAVILRTISLSGNVQRSIQDLIPEYMTADVANQILAEDIDTFREDVVSWVMSHQEDCVCGGRPNSHKKIKGLIAARTDNVKFLEILSHNEGINIRERVAGNINTTPKILETMEFDEATRVRMQVMLRLGKSKEDIANDQIRQEHDKDPTAALLQPHDIEHFVHYMRLHCTDELWLKNTRTNANAYVHLYLRKDKEPADVVCDKCWSVKEGDPNSKIDGTNEYTLERIEENAKDRQYKYTVVANPEEKK